MALRALILLGCGAAGCVFQVDGVPLGDSDGGAHDLPALLDGPGAPDFSIDLAGGSRPDLATGFCGAPGVVACYQFEDGATATSARDGTANHNDLTLTAATETPAGHTGGALSMATGGAAHVAHDAAFDVAQLTIELWVNPSALPLGTARAGLVDEDGQYGLFLYNPGTATCTAGGGSVSTPALKIVTNAWQHVACTYDRATLRLYYDGVQVSSSPSTGAIAGGQPNGLSVAGNSPSGDELSGMVDDVRLLGVARSAAEICADWGGGGC